MKFRYFYFSAIFIVFVACGFLKVGYCYAQNFENGIILEIFVKDKFIEGDNLEFSYVIKSEDYGREITFIPGITCDGNVPEKFPEENTFSFVDSKEYSGNYQGLKVEPDFFSQKCTAFVDVIHPLFKKYDKDFFVDTKIKADVKFLVCVDEKCGEEARRIITGSPFYLVAYLAEKEMVVEAEITGPNDYSKTVKLPNSIILSQEGEYEIHFQADAPGFQKTEEYRIVKVEKGLSGEEMKEKNQCLCENKEECPQDCVKATVIKSELDLAKKIIIVVGIILGLALIGYLISRRKNKFIAD